MCKKSLVSATICFPTRRHYKSGRNKTRLMLKTLRMQNLGSCDVPGIMRSCDHALPTSMSQNNPHQTQKNGKTGLFSKWVSTKCWLFFRFSSFRFFVSRVCFPSVFLHILWIWLYAVKFLQDFFCSAPFWLRFSVLILKCCILSCWFASKTPQNKIKH